MLAIDKVESVKQILEQRRFAVQNAMLERGISALFMYGMSSYAASGAVGHGYIRYLTDWTGRFGASALILPAQGRPTLLIPSGHDQLYVNESFPWVEKGVVETPPNYGKLARRIIGHPKGAVGLVGPGDFSSSVYRGLTEGNDAEFVDATEILDNMRMTKDDFELARHRRAAQISDRMFERLSRFFRSSRVRLGAL